MVQLQRIHVRWAASPLPLTGWILQGPFLEPGHLPPLHLIGNPTETKNFRFCSIVTEEWTAAAWFYPPPLTILNLLCIVVTHHLWRACLAYVYLGNPTLVDVVGNIWKTGKSRISLVPLEISTESKISIFWTFTKKTALVFSPEISKNCIMKQISCRNRLDFVDKWADLDRLQNARL